MNRSSWDRAKSLLADAADLPAADRERFVVEHCPDPELRREVLELLTSPAALSGIVAVNALAPGDRLGPYKIQALLGVGGMGEVYRGRDTRLGRDVALKVISPKLVGDPSLRRRFELEARAASALNHPAIVTVYDVGDTDGVSWIAMEWVEGRTLRQALSGGSLAIRDACSIAVQIAEGLAAAHAKGVVHRDLKPENVMLAADARTKILDFGLARQTFVDTLETSTSETAAGAAQTVAASFEGTILGTVGYMSPEQASGRSVDFRSDQFALGLIAYEMLAGRRAFQRPTAVETLSAVIREDPVPLSSIRSGIPAALLGVIARCLAKAPDDRFASTRDLAAALASVGTSSSLETRSVAASLAPTEMLNAPTRRATPRRPTRRAAVLLGAALVLALAAAAWNRFTTSRSAIDSLAVLPFENASNDPDAEYLGDGLTESLITQMSRVSSLKVMARGTVFRFKGAADPQEAGRKLGVGAVVTGTVARRGKQLVISAELIEIPTGIRLWGQTYDRPFADFLRVQDSIASDISEGLRLRLSGQDKRTLVAHGTENPEAYELFLKGRVLLVSDSEAGDLEARRLFLLAVEKDPKFVQAHLGVAATYARSAGNGYAPPAEAWARVDEEIRQVLALDPGSVAARASLAARHFQFDWDWPAAEREFREVSADPRLFLGNQYQAVAIFYWARGRPEDAVALMERALRVDPGNVESRTMTADFLAEAGRLEEAVSSYKGIVETEPAEARPLFGLAEVLKRRGDVTGAIDILRRAYELSKDENGTHALAAARTEKDYKNAEVAVARGRLEDLEALAKERYVSPLEVARLYAQLGERERAFESLDLALAERSGGLVLLKVDRAWDRVRDDARFAAAVRRVGIP
jgi:serine/threonine protein kinase/tetratricopeptide (TPR) repeat protein